MNAEQKNERIMYPEHYLALKALEEGITIKGYETPLAKCQLLTFRSIADAIAFALESNNFDALLSITKYDHCDDLRQRIEQALGKVAVTPDQKEALGEYYLSRKNSDTALQYYEGAGKLGTCTSIAASAGDHKKALMYAEIAFKNGVCGNAYSVAGYAEKAGEFSRAAQLYTCHGSLDWAAQAAVNGGDLDEGRRLFQLHAELRLAEVRKYHLTGFRGGKREDTVAHYGSNIKDWRVYLYEKLTDERCDPTCAELNQKMAREAEYLSQCASKIGLESEAERLQVMRTDYVKLGEGLKKRGRLANIGRKLAGIHL